jgi:D-hydroxyproline dehydrogenase subunit gamma
VSAIEAATVVMEIDGRRVAVRPGISVAAAVLNAGEARLRKSVRGEARGPLCGMGSCYECRVTIDGVAQQRACLTAVREGMRVGTGG